MVAAIPLIDGNYRSPIWGTATTKEAALKDCVHLMQPIIDASRDYVTLGEMCDALREVWGVWRETPVF